MNAMGPFVECTGCKFAQPLAKCGKLQKSMTVDYNGSEMLIAWRGKAFGSKSHLMARLNAMYYHKRIQKHTLDRQPPSCYEA
jgi:hypothetical protein